jgi:3-deoxy-D-arabino-heptulosonate 7-phosphate (DAHP) synthase
MEVHPAPKKAISDGALSLDLAGFDKMMRELKPYVAPWEASRKGEALAAAG